MRIRASAIAVATLPASFAFGHAQRKFRASVTPDHCDGSTLFYGLRVPKTGVEWHAKSS